MTTRSAAAAEAAEPASHRAFCVVQGLEFAHHVRKPATRVAITAHAEFFVDDDDLGGPAFVSSLAGAFEERVLPSSNASFGPPTDVDENGKVLVLLTHELGTHLNGGWLIGYFGNGDLLRARDSSPDCSEGGSNHGEIIYLNALANGVANGYSARELIQTTFPATLAHELQHLVNLGQRCVGRACAGGEETWINESLSKLAEDLAGYGWNAAQGRAEGALYLSRSPDGEVRGYEGRSLTKWEGDPIGNYQGAHSFMRFFADRRPQLPAQLVRGPGGNAALAAALCQPLPHAMAQWATALLLSNEPDAPWSFSGEAWSPFHTRLRHLEVRRPGETARLRTDGFAAFVSSGACGGPAQVVVHSSEALPPHVAVVRIHGPLPLW